MRINPERVNKFQVEFKGPESSGTLNSRLPSKTTVTSILKSMKSPSNVWFMMGSILLALESKLGDSLSILFILLARIIFDYFIEHYSSRNSQVSVWNGIRFQKMQSSKLATGDLILLEQNQNSPCKLIILASLTPSIEFIKTSGNLVSKNPARDTQELLSCSSEELTQSIQKLNFQVTFADNLEKAKLKLQNYPRSTGLLKSNFASKGSTLVSSWLVGLVVLDKNSLDKISSPYFRKSVFKLGWTLVIFLGLSLGVLALYERISQSNKSNLVFCYLFSLVLIPLPLLILLDALRFFYSKKFQKKLPEVTFNKKLLNENLAKIEYSLFSKSSLLKNEDFKASSFFTASSFCGLNQSLVGKSASSNNENSTFLNSKSELLSSTNVLLRDQDFEAFVQAVAVCSSVEPRSHRNPSARSMAIADFLDTLGVEVSEHSGFLLTENCGSIQSFRVLRSHSQKPSKVEVLVESSGSFYLFVKANKEEMEEIAQEREFGNGVAVCYASASLSSEQTEQFVAEYDYAISVPFDPKTRINEVFGKYEQYLNFVGAVVMNAQISEQTRKTIKKIKSAGIKHVMVSSGSYESTLNAGVSSEIIGAGNSLVEIENSVSPLTLKSDLEELLNGILFSEFGQSSIIGPRGSSRRHHYFSNSGRPNGIYYEVMDPENELFKAKIKYDKKRNVHPFIDRVVSMNESELLSFKRTSKPNRFDLVLTGEVLKHALEVQESKLYLAVLFLLAESVVVSSLSGKKLVHNFIKECNPNSTMLSLCPQINSEVTVDKGSEFEVSDYKTLGKLIFKVGVSVFLGLKKACELYFYQSCFGFNLNLVFLVHSGLSSFTVTGLTFFDVFAYLVSILNIGLVATAEPHHPMLFKEQKNLKFLVKAFIESTLQSLITNAGLILTYTSSIDSKGLTESKDLLTSSYILCFYLTVQLKILLTMETYTLRRTIRSLLLALVVMALVFFKYGVTHNPFYTVFSSPKLALTVLTIPLANFALSFTVQKVSLKRLIN